MPPPPEDGSLEVGAPYLPTSTDPTQNIPQITAVSPIATFPLRHDEIGKKGTSGYTR
jgi:hypothetical protein